MRSIVASAVLMLVVGCSSNRSSEDGWVIVAGGEDATCALQLDTTGTCWGCNSEDVGSSESLGKCQSPPDGYVDISVGKERTCAIRNDRTLECWPYDEEELGPLPIGKFDEVAVGEQHICVRYDVDTGDNRVECWNWPDGATVTIPSIPMDQVVAGRNHVCVIDQSGSLGCFAPDAFADKRLELPDGAADGTDSVGGLTYKAVSSGDLWNCAIGKDDRLTCFGDLPEDSDKWELPDQALGVAVGWDHVCVLEIDDQSVSCFGDNEHKQLNAPTRLYSQLSSGAHHTCGVEVTGYIGCWGRNDKFQAQPP